MRLKDWAMLRGISRDIMHLNCSGQHLTSLEGLEDFTALTSLECEGNRLTWLPDMDRFQHLDTIYAARNQLVRVGRLPWALTHLNLTNNQLTELPSFEGCSRLQFFSCAINQLEKIDDLSHTSLMYIDLRENRLRRTPSVPEFTHHVLLDGNPIDDEEEPAPEEDNTNPT